jgi:hypothetical protein
MPRKKYENPEDILTHPIVIRVTKTEFERLEKLATESNCHTIGEVARKILSNEKILLFHRDISMNGPMEELALIRKELKAIGVNINQQTRYFHNSRSDAQRSFHAMKTAEAHKKLEPRINDLLQIINRLAEKWLQGSSTEKG